MKLYNYCCASTRKKKAFIEYETRIFIRDLDDDHPMYKNYLYSLDIYKVLFFDYILNFNDFGAFIYLVNNGINLNRKLSIIYRISDLKIMKYICRSGIKYDIECIVANRNPSVTYNFIKFSRNIYQNKQFYINVLGNIRGFDSFKYLTKFIKKDKPSLNEVFNQLCIDAKSNRIEYLIKLGADINNGNSTPLKNSISYDNYYCVKTLLEHGAKITDEVLFKTPNKGIIELLIKTGANFRANNNKILRDAICHRDFPMVRYLIRFKFKVRENDDLAFKITIDNEIFDGFVFLMKQLSNEKDKTEVSNRFGYKVIDLSIDKHKLFSIEYLLNGYKNIKVSAAMIEHAKTSGDNKITSFLQNRYQKTKK